MKTTLKKNKALFILPLILLPFVVLIFYILGGGNPSENEGQNNTRNEGANYSIPQAESSIEIADKLETYEQQAGRASTRDYGILANMDSSNNQGQPLILPEDSVVGEDSEGEVVNANISNNLLAHIKQKEAEINRELNAPGSRQIKSEARTEKSVKSVNSKNPSKYESPVTTEPTPVILQKTGIEELDQVFEENVALTRQNDSLKFILRQMQQQQPEQQKKEKTKFTLEKKNGSAFQKQQPKNSLIRAEIYETSTVLDCNRVKLRLLEDTWIDGIQIPENTFIYGICKVSNERLHITVTQLPVENRFLPVDLAIHDLDGLPGLYVPGNAARKVTREVGSSTNTSSIFGMTDNPLTYAGIRAADRTAQTLLRRVRLKKVTVKKNTLVYLINQNQ
jgi:conjugative transposon TraM protein